jgi:hypothetical protein
VIHLTDSYHTTEEEAGNLLEALKQMVGPKEMGARYKALAIARKGAGTSIARAWREHVFQRQPVKALPRDLQPAGAPFVVVPHSHG